MEALRLQKHLRQHLLRTTEPHRHLLQDSRVVPRIEIQTEIRIEDRDIITDQDSMITRDVLII